MNKITQHRLNAIQCKINGGGTNDSIILQYIAIILANENSCVVSKAILKSYCPSVVWC